LIVFGVRGGHRVSATRLPDLREKRVACAPRRHFHRPPFARSERWNVDAISHKRDFEPLAEHAAELLILVGIGVADGVMKMRGRIERQLAGNVKIAQDEHKRDRVGAT
jgi:hypothetical protein